MEDDDILAVLTENSMENSMHMRNERANFTPLAMKGFLLCDVRRTKEFCRRAAESKKETKERMLFDKAAAGDDAWNSRTATTIKPAERKWI